MALGDWWDIDTWILEFSGVGALGLEDIQDKDAGKAYADQMIAVMGEGEWKAEWFTTAYSITEAAYANSVDDDVLSFWNTLTANWLSFDGYAQTEGIPYWRELGEFWASEAGYTVQWQEIAQGVTDALKPKGLWDDLKPWVYGAGAIIVGAQVYKAVK